MNTPRTGLNYPNIGVTRGIAVESPNDSAAGWPAGFHRVDLDLQVGTGHAAFAALAEGIMTWQIQRLAGLTVRAPDRATVGARVVSGFGVGALRLPVPCEVVWAHEPATMTRADGMGIEFAGFGYGTLPGHPELGEEAFAAIMTASGAVHFRLVAFSKPGSLIAKLGSPVAALAQRAVTRGYLNAARSLAGGF
ncbi:DUF1990 family protein [Specibacter cremeus]|uniref:DUF1990 family protein n=1 Tax=Specibacter cremeus TaxID=1629051 RepID=UPI0013DE411D|nr:DUF1990 domain-containing protein [Specibacter cremeus]